MSLDLANLQAATERNAKRTHDVPNYSTAVEPTSAGTPPATSPHTESVWLKLVNFAAIFVLAVLATLFFIYYSWYWGRLSSRIPTYDDLSYFRDALLRTSILREPRLLVDLCVALSNARALSLVDLRCHGELCDIRRDLVGAVRHERPGALPGPGADQQHRPCLSVVGAGGSC